MSEEPYEVPMDVESTAASTGKVEGKTGGGRTAEASCHLSMQLKGYFHASFFCWKCQWVWYLVEKGEACAQ